MDILLSKNKPCERLIIARRAWYFFAGVVAPPLCFLFSPLEGDWQSGRMGDYLAEFLGREANWVWLPLASYSWLALGYVLLFSINRRPPATVRFGVYAGAALSSFFALTCYAYIGARFGIFAGTAGDWLVLGIIAAVVGAIALLPYGLLRLCEWLGPKPYWHWLLPPILLVLGVLAHLAVFCLLLVGYVSWADGQSLLQTFSVVAGSVGEVLSVWVAFVLMATPLWIVSTYWSMVARVQILAVGKEPGPRWPWIAAGGAYGGAYGVTLYFAYERMRSEYYALPPHSPCFIATAAARGHRWLTGAEQVGDMRVSEQLRVFKLAEIALACAAPTWHRRLRAVYDRIGPALAARVKNRWLADVAYLLLKPAEYCARAAFLILLDDPRRLWRRLYDEPKD